MYSVMVGFIRLTFSLFLFHIHNYSALHVFAFFFR